MPHARELAYELSARWVRVGGLDWAGSGLGWCMPAILVRAWAARARLRLGTLRAWVVRLCRAWVAPECVDWAADRRREREEKRKGRKGRRKRKREEKRGPGERKKRERKRKISSVLGFFGGRNPII